MTLTLRLAALCLALAACGGQSAPPSAAKAATVTAPVKEAQLTTVTLTADATRRLAIKAEGVVEGSLPGTRTVGGEVTVPAGMALTVTAPVAGTLRASGEIPIVGSRVSRGQVLFRLTPLQTSEREATVSARLAVDSATARREASLLKVQRAERLVADGSVSRRSLEEARAELALADAELKAARERVALSPEDGSGGVTIQAPDAGLVQNVHVRGGEAVAAGSPLLEVVKLERVWIRVPVYAGEVANIDRSGTATVVSLGAGREATGVLARPAAAPPSANAGTSTVDLYFELDNAGTRFRPGERVAVRLPTRESRQGLIVPVAALLHDALGGTWVYVVGENNTYIRTRVTVADISGDRAVLSQGPAAGQRVVTDGAAELFGVEFGAGK